MLDSKIKKILLEKISCLITEKNESELLKKEFIEWFNNEEKLFKNNLNDSEKKILEKYPNLVIKYTTHVDLYYQIKWNSCNISSDIFDFKDLSLLEEDDKDFYRLKDLIVYPAIFVFNKRYPLNSISEKIFKEVYSKLSHLIRVRKRYLEKLVFIKRVLDSSDLTLTILKETYPDLYNLYDENEKSTKTIKI